MKQFSQNQPRVEGNGDSTCNGYGMSGNWVLINCTVPFERCQKHHDLCEKDGFIDPWMMRFTILRCILTHPAEPDYHIFGHCSLWDSHPLREHSDGGVQLLRIWGAAPQGNVFVAALVAFGVKLAFPKSIIFGVFSHKGFGAKLHVCLLFFCRTWFLSPKGSLLCSPNCSLHLSPSLLRFLGQMAVVSEKVRWRFLPTVLCTCL